MSSPGRAVLAVGVWALAATAAGATPDPEAVTRGQELLRSRGCVACHSLDGRATPGPTFAGAFGRPRRVLEGGAPREVHFDAAYLARSLAEPNAQVVAGFPPGLMPRFEVDEAGRADLAAALAALSSEEAPPPPPPGPLWPLLVAAALFVFGHLFLSAGPIRSRLVARLGEAHFQGLYSLVVVAAFGWMIQAWSAAPFIPLWDAWAWTRWIPFLAMPPILVLLVTGMLTRSPTAVGQQRALSGRPVGVIGVTRHPVNLATGAWGLVHLPPNGDLAAVVFFGSFVLLAVLGTWHIERRRAAADPEAWAAFGKATSIIPFGAVLRGRSRIHWGEIGLLRPSLGLLVWALALWSHGLVTGASPLP